MDRGEQPPYRRLYEAATLVLLACWADRGAIGSLIMLRNRCRHAAAMMRLCKALEAICSPIKTPKSASGITAGRQHDCLCVTGYMYGVLDAGIKYARILIAGNNQQDQECPA
jgi:hypothetical protein